MRILTILLIAYIFYSSFAQQGKRESKKITDEMTEVLLDAETSEKVYNIQLKRFIDAQAIRKTHKDDKEKMKEELKGLYNRLYGKLKGILGQEQMKVWNQIQKIFNKLNFKFMMKTTQFITNTKVWQNIFVAIMFLFSFSINSQNVGDTDGKY